MTDEVPPTDLLPLVFTTALVVYVLALGSVDLARSVIRIGAMTCAAFCLAVWGAAALDHASWGEPVIQEFYATALLARHSSEERRVGPGGVSTWRSRWSPSHYKKS